MSKKKDILNMIIYVLIAYAIGYFGFYLWFVLGYDLAGFVAIAAPITAYFITRKIRKDIPKVKFKNISCKAVFIGAGVPILYTIVGVVIYIGIGGELLYENLSIKNTIILIIQWVFAGVCEEVGWRGFLFPTLKKRYKDWIAYLVCGVIWSGWHFPMILSNTIMSSWSIAVGVILLLIEAVAMNVIIDKLMQLTKMSIWTSIFFHAGHNFVVQLLLSIVPLTAYPLLDDGSFISLPLIVLTAVILWIYTYRKMELKHDSDK